MTTRVSDHVPNGETERACLEPVDVLRVIERTSLQSSLRNTSALLIIFPIIMLLTIQKFEPLYLYYKDISSLRSPFKLVCKRDFLSSATLPLGPRSGSLQSTSQRPWLCPRHASPRPALPAGRILWPRLCQKAVGRQGEDTVLPISEGRSAGGLGRGLAWAKRGEGNEGRRSRRGECVWGPQAASPESPHTGR